MKKNISTKSISTVNDVRELTTKGPWPTKSNGQLNVLFSLDIATITNQYFKYDKSELDKITTDVRGLRLYSVSGLQIKSVGANEWHKLRNELVFAIHGSAKWTCEDVFGKKVEHIINQSSGLWVPPYILHTYEALQDDTELLVVASTLFIPDDPTTHDTYDAGSFANMQNSYRNS